MDFQIINKGITSEVVDDTLYIDFLANSGCKDMNGDVLTQQALETIVKQATNHNLHLEHDKSVDGILGPIVSAEQVEEGVKMRARIRDEKRELIEPLLTQGVNLGTSVSGSTIRNPYNPNDIGNWNLLEVSLLAVPADQRTMGKVGIVAKSFKEIITMEEKQMADETKDFITKDEVIELINTGINERQEETLEKIRDEVKSEYETIITELTKRVETLESQIQEPTPTETNEGTSTEPEETPVDKGFNPEEIVEATLHKIFGGAANDGLNVKYTDKGFEFESPATETREGEGEDTTPNPQEGEVVDKKFSISEIARMM